MGELLGRRQGRKGSVALAYPDCFIYIKYIKKGTNELNIQELWRSWTTEFPAMQRTYVYHHPVISYDLYRDSPAIPGHRRNYFNRVPGTLTEEYCASNRCYDGTLLKNGWLTLIFGTFSRCWKKSRSLQGCESSTRQKFSFSNSFWHRTIWYYCRSGATPIVMPHKSRKLEIDFRNFSTTTYW